MSGVHRTKTKGTALCTVLWLIQLFPMEIQDKNPDTAIRYTGLKQLAKRTAEGWSQFLTDKQEAARRIHVIMD